MRNPIYSVLSIALVLLAAPAIVSRAAAGEAPGKAFGPPPGSFSEFSATIRLEGGGDERTIGPRFPVQVVRAPAKQSGDAVVILPKAASFPLTTGFPIFLVHLGNDGNPEGTAEDPLDLWRVLLPQAVFAGIGGGAIEAGSAWKERLECPASFLADESVVHEAESIEGRPGAVRVKSRKVAGNRRPGAAGSLQVRKWEREVVVDLASARILTATVSLHVLVPGSAGSQPRTAAWRIDVQETSSRPLTPAEAKRLPEEVADLRSSLEEQRAAAARRPGLPTQKEEAKDDEDLLAFLDGTTRPHLSGKTEPSDPLADPAARKRIAGRRRTSGPGGERAPDFTLMDLQGRSVSLSDFRGKVVVLAFWGYG